MDHLARVDARASREWLAVGVKKGFLYRFKHPAASSMSRRGNCWDVNACSETLFGSLKVELLHGQRFVSRRHAKDETIAWLLWYNQARLRSTLAYVSPMQFESEWIVRQANS